MKNVFSPTARHRGLQAIREAAHLGVASIWIRMAAALLDLGMIWIISMFGAVTALIILRLNGIVPQSSTATMPHTLRLAIGIFVLLAYFVPSETIAGVTFGKLPLRLRVVREDGTPCTLVAAILRNLLFLVDTFYTLVICLSDSPMNQRFGDMLARTVVVSTKQTKLQRKWPLGKSLLAIMASWISLFVFAVALCSMWVLRERMFEPAV